MSWYPKAFGSGTSVEGSICIFEHFWLREKAGAIDKGGRAHKSLGTLGWACGLREKAGETRSYRQGRMCSTSPLGPWEEQVVSVSWQLNEYYFWSDLHTRVPTASRISVFVQKSVFCPGSIALKTPFLVSDNSDFKNIFWNSTSNLDSNIIFDMIALYYKDIYACILNFLITFFCSKKGVVALFLVTWG